MKPVIALKSLFHIFTTATFLVASSTVDGSMKFLFFFWYFPTSRSCNRRSLGGLPPKFLKDIVILCVEMPCPKQNSAFA